MRKYFDENGKEVKFGDVVKVVSDSETCMGKMHTELSAVLTKEFVDEFEAAGWITHEEYVKENSKYYLNKVGNKLGGEVSLAHSLLSILHKGYPHLVVSILLREVATELNNYHKDNILNYDEVWGVNKYNTKQVLNLGKPNHEMLTISVFRSCSEAQKAAEIVENIIKSL